MSRLAVILSVLLLAGCTTVKNTPRQEYVWTMIHACRLSVPGQCEVTNVDANGQWHGTCVTISAGWGQFEDCARDWQLAHPYREWVQQTTGAPVGQTKIDRMRADFGECRALVYPTAQLTVLREDGTFSLELCLKQKGYRIDS